MLVGGLIGFGVYKMSKSQAQQIEQHTGVPPDEMTDEELSRSMDELDIPKQKIDSNDREAAAGDATGSPTQGGVGWADEIEKLAELRDKGVLTDEEFEAKKSQILGT
jgi:hypothetical protein